MRIQDTTELSKQMWSLTNQFKSKQKPDNAKQISCRTLAGSKNTLSNLCHFCSVQYQKHCIKQNTQVHIPKLKWHQIKAKSHTFKSTTSSGLNSLYSGKLSTNQEVYTRKRPLVKTMVLTKGRFLVYTSWFVLSFPEYKLFSPELVVDLKVWLLALIWCHFSFGICTWVFCFMQCFWYCTEQKWHKLLNVFFDPAKVRQLICLALSGFCFDLNWFVKDHICFESSVVSWMRKSHWHFKINWMES